MGKAHWTGHPFVDAGLAAIAAIAKVDRLEDLTSAHLEDAVAHLRRILLSDQALGIGVERAFSGPKKTLRFLFPNSELDNPSNWKGTKPEEKLRNVQQKFDEALREDLKNAVRCLQSDGGDAICQACGEWRPSDAIIFVRKDKMPLLVGIVNFYPAFAYGVGICGLCALAVRFLPMSVMRTGAENRLWFLHTQALPIAEAIAWRYGWEHFNQEISRNESLDFFSKWETAGDEGTVLYLLCELLESLREQLQRIFSNPLPMTAYIFSNDLRNTYVQPISIPNELLMLLYDIQLCSSYAFLRFWHELLQVPEGLEETARNKRSEFVRFVAHRMVNMEDIIGIEGCLNHEMPKLLGGWVGHRLYLKEVRKMPMSKLAILERLGIAIAQSDDAKRRIMELRAAERRDIYSILLRYVREGWLSHQDFYSLLPPGEDTSAAEVRDILLAVIYEWQYCQERGETFQRLEEPISLTPDETLKRIQEVGKRLIARLSNISRWIGQLQTARTVDRIRSVYLTAVRQGALGFDDFVFLSPLGDRQRLWLLRDYILAFLFDHAKEALPEEEIVAGEEMLAAMETLERGDV